MRFSEKTYFNFRMNMDINNHEINVADVGCHLGQASDYFLDGKYVGIDNLMDSTIYHNEWHPNVNYVSARFPAERAKDAVRDAGTLLSAFSLGFYGKDGSCKGVDYLDEEHFDVLASGIAVAKRAYLATTNNFATYLRKRVSTFRELSIEDKSWYADGVKTIYIEP
jgi:hypothetical protein